MSMAIANRRDQRTATGGLSAQVSGTSPLRRVRQEPIAMSMAQRVVVDRTVGWSSDPRQSVADRRRRRANSARMRGRILLFAATILTLVGLVVAFGQLAGATDTSRPQSPTAIMTVQSGDSLWTIAMNISQRSDPRETIDRIRELNGLRDSVIVPGQQLIVPQGV